MFSPIGYTSLAKLWQVFTTKYYAHIYSKAAEDYAGTNARRSFDIGSPADICEHIFLTSFLKYRIVVARSHQDIAKIDIALDRQFNFLYSTTSVFESKLIADDPTEAGVDGAFLGQFGSIRFKPWPYEHDDPIAWKTAYPELTGNSLGLTNIESAKFHTLPFVFERLRFIVPETMPPWASDAFHKEYVDRIISSFPGWSLCLDDGDLDNWSKSCSARISKFF